MQFVSHISHIMHNRNLQVQQNWNWGIIGYSSFLSSYFTSLQLFGTKNLYILSPYKLYLNPAQRLKMAQKVSILRNLFEFSCQNIFPGVVLSTINIQMRYLGIIFKTL